PRKMFADNIRIERWAHSNRSFESIAGYREWRLSVTGQGAPERLDAIIAVGDLFRTLGVRPALGREFLPDEVRADGARVAILSHSYWQRRFGADPAVIGRSIRLDGYPFTIVGVMPAGFAPVLPRAPHDADIWTTPAVDFTAHGLNGGRTEPFVVCQAIGRLRPGVSLAQAQAEFNGIAKAMEPERRAFRG